jgi:hypothetical protein
MRHSILFSGPFTTAEAYSAGLTSGILRGPSVRRLFAGVYVSAEVESSEQVLLDLVTAGDWLLRRNRCRLPSLQAYASSFTGRGAVPPMGTSSFG